MISDGESTSEIAVVEDRREDGGPGTGAEANDSNFGDRSQVILKVNISSSSFMTIRSGLTSRHGHAPT